MRWTVSCSVNRAVLQMLKREEIQGQELPLAIITSRQGNSSCLTSCPKSRTHHRALKSRGLSHCVRRTQKSGTQRHTGADTKWQRSLKHSRALCLSLKASARGSGPALLLLTHRSQTSQGFPLHPFQVSFSKLCLV